MKKPLRRKLVFLLAVASLAAACVTVNIYFPAAQVEKTAEEIVKDVYQEKDKKPAKPEGGTHLLQRLLAGLGPAEALAADATTVSNAAIRTLKNKIASRHGQLARFYSEGRIGINKGGMLVIRNIGGLGVKDAATLRRLVAADNQDRSRLYQEVAKALKLPANQVPKIQAIFARQWRDQAQAKWWVQQDNGKWMRK
jgi:uncharacterized protein YdbL (DUF1318 family)